jgi:hypothetical protein
VTRSWFLWVAGALALALCSGSAAGRPGPEAAAVPLTIVALDGGGLKIGIALRLGGGAPQLYTFDTGSSGFYAAYTTRSGGPPSSPSRVRS